MGDPPARELTGARTRRALLLLALVSAAACGGPLGPLAGGRLAGTPAEEPVRDWSFAEGYSLAQIEVRPGDPYSVNVNFAVAAGRLYLDIGTAGDWNRWRAMIRADPRVRLRIGDTVYTGTAVAVTDPAERAAADAAFARRLGTPPAATSTLVRIDP